MKNTIKIVGAIALTAVLLFASCAFEQPNPAAAGGNGNLLISFGSGADARTLVPGADQFAGYRLELTRQVVAGNPLYDETLTYNLVPGTTDTEVDLTVGTWTVLITAYTAAGDSVYGTKSVTIQANRTAAVSIVLDTYVEATAGTFDYLLSFPDLDHETVLQEGYRSATIVLTPVDWSIAGETLNTITLDMIDNSLIGGTITKDGDRYTVAGKLQLPPGRYTMDLQIQSNRAFVDGGDTYYGQVYRHEVVYIYSNMVTYTPRAANGDSLYYFEDRDFTNELYFTGNAQILENPAGKTYVPKLVQVAWFNPNAAITNSGGKNPNSPAGEADDHVLELLTVAGDEGADGTIDAEGNWALYINTHHINYHHTNQDVTANVTDSLQFRIIAQDGADTVAGAWKSIQVRDIHGRTLINPHNGSTDTAMELRDHIKAFNNVPNATSNYVTVPAGTTISTSLWTAEPEKLPGTISTVNFAEGSDIKVTVSFPNNTYGMLNGFAYTAQDFVGANWDDVGSPYQPTFIKTEDNKVLYSLVVPNVDAGQRFDLDTVDVFQLTGQINLLASSNPHGYKASAVTAYVRYPISVSPWYEVTEIATAAVATDGTWTIAIPAYDWDNHPYYHKARAAWDSATVTFDITLVSTVAANPAPAITRTVTRNVANFDTDSGSQVMYTSLETPIMLNFNEWKDDTLASLPAPGKLTEYFAAVIPARAGYDGNPVYYIRWNDNYQGDGTKTLDARVRGNWYSDTSSAFNWNSYGYTTNVQNIYNSEYNDAVIMLTVEPNYTGAEGTYAIGYYANVWEADTLSIDMAQIKRINMNGAMMALATAGVVRNAGVMSSSDYFIVPFDSLVSGYVDTTQYDKVTITAQFFNTAGTTVITTAAGYGTARMNTQTTWSTNGNTMGDLGMAYSDDPTPHGTIGAVLSDYAITTTTARGILVQHTNDAMVGAVRILSITFSKDQ